ncbi:hypothetical protein LOC68_16325 [Blastopirellula sp. JC732]|uniref:Leucine Rich repeats (2 copies) n=1 Tax=Blastopirellula sediminis TaxID=2894196 RepID=A0A9X1MQX2_9BACT|nr:hypothetical protein [Blastopirellula sediminis]MCC9606744.1 hypothetical protein [Blastopirellula sediminis]MCC9629959.1 hypothetical protein [Blastopirellula sediminis]
MPDADPPELIETLRELGARLRLRKSGRLHTVDFSPCGAAIGDVQLALLDEAQKLEELDLSGTSVTDAGVEPLAGHKTLKLLTLSGSQVSGELVKSLRKRMIGCRIVFLEAR